jgi:hypothetical protein
MAYNPFSRSGFDQTYAQAASARGAAAPGRGLLPSSYYYSSGRPMNPSIVNAPVGAGGTGYTPGSYFSGSAAPNLTAGGLPLTSSPTSPANDARNPYFPISIVKEPEARKTAEGQLASLQSGQDASKKTLDDYIKEFEAMLPTQKSSMEQQSSAIADVFNPSGLRSRYYGELQNFEDAARALRDRSVAAARTATPSNMGVGSAYLGGIASRASDAEERMLRDVAAQRLGAEPLLTNLAMSNVGREQSLRNAYLQNLLAPAVARQSLLSGDVGNLGNILRNLGGTTSYYMGKENAVQPSFTMTTNAGSGVTDPLANALAQIQSQAGGWNVPSTASLSQPSGVSLYGQEELIRRILQQRGQQAPQRDIQGNPIGSPYYNPDMAVNPDLSRAVSDTANTPAWFMNPLYAPADSMTFSGPPTPEFPANPAGTIPPRQPSFSVPNNLTVADLQRYIQSP